jgi:DNA topoisomerase VI subunit B
MENKTLLQKAEYLLNLILDDATRRLEESLTKPQSEEVNKEKNKIIALVKQFLPFAFKLHNLTTGNSKEKPLNNSHLAERNQIAGSLA